MNDWTILLIVLIVAAIVVAVGVKRGWFSFRRGGGGAVVGMTIHHDWMNRDAQRGMEVIIKRNAGEKETEQKSGEPDFEDRQESDAPDCRPSDV